MIVRHPEDISHLSDQQLITAAENPKNPVDVLRELYSYRHNPWVCYGLARNPSLPLDLILDMAKSHPQDVALNPTTPYGIWLAFNHWGENPIQLQHLMTRLFP